MVVFTWIVPLRDFVNAEDEFIFPEDNFSSVINETTYLYNAFMGSVPNHPLLQKMFDRIMAHINDHYIDAETSLGVTGPKALWKVFDEMVGEKALEIKTYQCQNSPFTIGILKHIAISKDFELYREFSSFITDGQEYAGLPNRPLFRTRYMNYSKDRILYHVKPHYSTMYSQGKVYAA